MGSSICLLNLDTGDFVDLGRLSSYKNAILEVGFEGEHRLLTSIPSIPYGPEGDKQESDYFLDVMRKTGHVLNAFLAASVGCRFIVVWKDDILDNVDGYMESSGYFYDSCEGDRILDEDGEFISESTHFYRKRLKPCNDKYRSDTDADFERIEKKKEHYKKEVQRALKMNNVYKRTGLGGGGRNHRGLGLFYGSKTPRANLMIAFNSSR